MNKEREIWKYSNPKEANHRAKLLFGDDYELDISTRKDKKYMIKGDFTNDKWVHFGAWGMEDYLKHGNDDRRDNFIRRNHKWKNMPENTPAFLSYFILW